MADNKNATAPQNVDDLEKSLQVTPPSAWIVLGAFTALMAGLLVWAVFGTVATTVHAKSVVVDGTVICLLSEEEAAITHAGDEAVIRGARFEVEYVTFVPVSRDEVKQEVKLDYLADALLEDSWGYAIFLTGDTSELPENVPLDTVITVERTSPISLVLGNGA